MRVDEIMIHQVIACHAHQPLDHAVRDMWNHGCGVLPVLDDAGIVVGMLTDRDALMCAFNQGRALHELRVDQAMAVPVASCRAQTSVGEALALMRDREVHRLPVLDDGGRLVGLLSVDDVAHASVEYRSHGPATRDVAETIAILGARQGPTALLDRRWRAGAQGD